jgi:cytochrome c
MKKLAIATLVSATVLAGGVFADGKAVFTAKGCTACHNLDKDQAAMGLGPSLRQIAKAYKGDAAGLTAFLKGSDKPKVYPDKYPTMKGQVAMTKTMPAADIDALVQYLTSN